MITVWIGIPSAIFQLYAISHITYRSLQHTIQVDNQPVPFQNNSISSEHQDDDSTGCTKFCRIFNIFKNTRLYNKVLYDLSTMIYLLVTVTIFQIGRSMIESGNPDLPFSSAFPFYFHDFAFFFLINVIFPTMFYVMHPEARRFIKDLIMCL